MPRHLPPHEPSPDEDLHKALWQLTLGIGAIVAALLLWGAVAGCGSVCAVEYRFDGLRYYRVQDCGHGPVVTCDSAERLPSNGCGTGDAPAKKE